MHHRTPKKNRYIVVCFHDWKYTAMPEDFSASQTISFLQRKITRVVSIMIAACKRSVLTSSLSFVGSFGLMKHSGFNIERWVIFN